MENEPLKKAENPEHRTRAVTETDGFLKKHRKSVITALTALAVLGTAPEAFAGEQSKEEKEELKQHTLKVGSVLGIAKHPSAGFEATYSWMPSADPSKKFHFVLTPFDFMVSQHHLELENDGHHSTVTRPRFFIGSLVGFTYLFNKYLELETGIGGGAAFIPYGHLKNGQLEGHSYQPTPVLKLDTQLDVIFDHKNHFGAYIGYSPELNIGAPHSITHEGVEKKTVVEHIVALGLRKDF